MTQEATTAETPSYTLALEGEGITIKQKITRDVALAIINVALGGGEIASTGARTGAAGAAGLSKPAGAGERTTPGEYIESVGAGTNPEKITAFGVFLGETRDQENFTREDIRAMFRAAHEPAPANFGRDFRGALSSNWIAEDGSDRYFVTATGQKAVASKFASKKPARKPRRRSRAAAGGDDG